MIHQVPIKSLPQEWLWCETWCSKESLKDAKSIDLCNNPLTKEPKLSAARRIVAKVNRLGILQTLLTTPCFAPKPLLWQAFNWDLVDHVVGQVLVQVAQRVGILAECLVLASQSVTSSYLPELDKVDHVNGGDVVFPTRQMVPPVTLLPESEPFHFGV